MEEYKKLIRQLQDFPKKGILFQDINPLLANWKTLHAASADLATQVSEVIPFVSKVLAIEARGFILGGVLASMLEAGMVPVRKKGKLPTYDSLRTVDYQLEYGTDSLSVDVSLLNYHDRILIFDDVLATGGTAEATFKLLEQESKNDQFAPLSQHNVCFAFMLEIEALKGRKYLSKQTGIPEENIISLIKV
ncbi:MAG: adenine phosphoribosyltransferase [Bacteroidales bacterium]|nr:adenine phosphoribosyltransferase [Bacteroidales bacterium]MDD4209947.1 adenine phosphoribosyltransferase [Bacteroidales bacterium]